MIEQTLKCDILGRRATEKNPIHKVRVVVQMLCKKTPDMELVPKRADIVSASGNDDSGEPGFCWVLHHATPMKDMCPDALKRAIKFAERAATPPNIAATQAAEIEPGIAS